MLPWHLHIPFMIPTLQSCHREYLALFWMAEELGPLCLLPLAAALPTSSQPCGYSAVVLLVELASAGFTPAVLCLSPNHLPAGCPFSRCFFTVSPWQADTLLSLTCEGFYLETLLCRHSTCLMVTVCSGCMSTAVQPHDHCCHCSHCPSVLCLLFTAVRS